MFGLGILVYWYLGGCIDGGQQEQINGVYLGQQEKPCGGKCDSFDKMYCDGMLHGEARPKAQTIPSPSLVPIYVFSWARISDKVTSACPPPLLSCMSARYFSCKANAVLNREPFDVNKTRQIACNMKTLMKFKSYFTFFFYSIWLPLMVFQ